MILAPVCYHKITIITINVLKPNVKYAYQLPKQLNL